MDKKGRLEGVRFSQHFNIDRPQEELDFVDIRINMDVRLFVDPFALRVGKTDFHLDASNAVVTFFASLMSNIKRGEHGMSEALEMLSYLHEANDVRLGYSRENDRGMPRGRGVGAEQAAFLYKKLSKSKAALSGNLRDLEDFALFVPQIDKDKISDITINIIRKHLLGYTQQQCELHGVEMERIHSKPIWDSNSWKRSVETNLPVYNGQPIVLVPKDIVRRRLTLSGHDCYRYSYVPYMQEEHYNNPSGRLVQVSRLGLRRRPTKKEIIKQYPFSKEGLDTFFSKNPKKLNDYKNSCKERSKPLSDDEIEAVLDKKDKKRK